MELMEKSCVRYEICTCKHKMGNFTHYKKPFTEYYANELNYLEMLKTFYELIITSATLCIVRIYIQTLALMHGTYRRGANTRTLCVSDPQIKL
ncbi:hypothetical protein T10_4659 [Trichinella papuae]|uniref:Uncharacterized protein n=1 Tax=Trichinella papuae TaxID=268474 RepID=A0A0V1MCF5_9BILA|nr:hypothetical protein T10_4659 [Trichinella papuae]